MYFAQIDEDNFVLQVIVADQDHIDSLEGNWIQTGMDGRVTKNYAGIGLLYIPSENDFKVHNYQLISRIELAKDANGKQLYYKIATGEQKNSTLKKPLIGQVFYLQDRVTGKTIKSKRPTIIIDPEQK